MARHYTYVHMWFHHFPVECVRNTVMKYMKKEEEIRSFEGGVNVSARDFSIKNMVGRLCTSNVQFVQKAPK